MNAIISLCHFCELHGPSVLFCTQAFHPNDDPQFDSTVDDGTSSCGASGWSFRGKYQRSSSVNSTASGPDGTSSAPPTPTGTKTTDFCEACRSATVGQQGFISNDAEAGVSYISSYQSHHRKVFSMVRQACVRSLSCEVCPGREGPIFFGDDHNGHVFSHTFYVKDSLARGFQRWYSIIVVMMDKIYLLNSWPFLVTNIRKVIDDIQAKADKVYEVEHAKHPTPVTHRLSSSNSSNLNFRQMRGPVKPARSILELTNDKVMFRNLHQSFTWILKAGGNRLKEILLEGPPTEDSVIDFEQHLEDTEDGFVLVFNPKTSISSDMDDLELLEKEEVHKKEPEVEIGEFDSAVSKFTSLRELLETLGFYDFHVLAHHVIIGNQVIVRCTHRPLLNSLIDVLKTLLPKGCCKVISWSDSYIDSWRCNFLGLKPGMPVPSHVELYVAVDIIMPDRDTTPVEGKPFAGYTFMIQSPLNLPEKAPVVLEKMEGALQNKKLADSVVDQCLICLKEEWMNKVKVRFMFTKAGAQSVDTEIRKLLPVIGANREDMPVLQFWMTGLSVQYKRHMLVSAKSRRT